MRSRTPSPLSQSIKPSIWPLLLLLLLVYLAQALYTLPLNRVIELRLCQEHYVQHDPSSIHQDGSIPEKLCKIDEVQRRLAWLQGIMETTIVVCDFLVTIPFSFVAEKFGVRVVLWCNLVPRIFLSLWALVVGNYSNIFPTKAILVGPFLTILGAECVFQSTIFTLTSALTTGHVKRASYFSYISSTSYVVNFMGPTIASLTMSRNLWLPFWLNIALLLCAIPTIKMLPDTHAPPIPTTTNTTIHTEANDSDDEENSIAEAGPLLSNRSTSPNRYANAFEANPHHSILHTLSHTLRKLTHLITGRKNFQILLFSFFLTALASSDTKLLVQYISKRYEWTFAQAGYMLSAKAIVNFTLLALVVPRILRSSSLSSKNAPAEIRTHYLGAEISIGISVVGVFCVALAAKFWILMMALIIYALGSALPVFTMSLVKSPLIALPQPQSRAGTAHANANAEAGIQDFSIVMLTKTLGSLVGAPVMMGLWVWAIKIGGMGLGLPYLVSGCIYIVAMVVVARLRF